MDTPGAEPQRLLSLKAARKGGQQVQRDELGLDVTAKRGSAAGQCTPGVTGQRL